MGEQRERSVCGDVRSKRLAAERRIVRERTEKVRGG
jgi:hypothetical protein